MAEYSFEDIEKQINNRKLHPVYILQGEETYFTDLLTRKFQDELLEEDEKAFNQEVYFGKETTVSTIIDSLSQFPMGSDYKLVLIRNAQELKDIDKLTSYVNDPFESSVLVLSFTGKSMDGGKKLPSIVKSKYGFFEAKTIYENQLPAWIKSEVKTKGKEISDQNATLIADYLGKDLQKISNELDKTVIAIGDAKEINQEHIENYIGINREFNVFELINSIFNKNPYKARLIVEYLTDNLNKQPLTLILNSLFNSFLKLYLLKVNNPKSDMDITAIIGTRSISAIKEYRTAMANFSLPDLDYAMYLFKIHDQLSKGIDSGNADHGELLKELVFKLLHVKEVQVCPK